MVETLKIGMLSWESMHSIQVGGLSKAVTGMAEGLAENGQDVHVFTRGYTEQLDREEIGGVDYHRCKFDHGNGVLDHSRKMCRAMEEAVRVEEERYGEFDIIHGHDWMVVDALKGFDDRYKVMSFHSTESGRNGGRTLSGRTSEKISEKEWLGGYVSDRVVTVSDVMKKELQKLYQIPPGKISVVPNGTDTQSVDRGVDPGTVKERYGIHPLAPLLMFLGRMEYQKGPDIMVDSIPHILEHRDDSRIVMAGAGGMRNQVEERAGQLGVSQSTDLLGYVREEEKLDLLKASDIVCMPSRNEPFGLVLFEAWASKTAVVASNVGGLSENIDNLENGIKTFPNPVSFAGGINHIIDNPDQIQELGEKGQKKLKKFSWGRIGEKLLKVYSGS
ncbi:hypothetical protein AKJ37_02605 [candidate division MSBL1 archaeon SCGC-AAA259I09]|uniref:Glycosyl transferase family 1 n=3 Tax=candidate division MSBL1 TaxID=215777 RepID=A0A133UTS7_9EURY|nr:hypothetical protein AKJ62_03955 [candidate division MSBL1 archaeon SCGC-AAA259D14]KXA95394.1 hypothetical protein AKJ36_00660 [candidate division MSBL1 archaeon SCGC-AAA259I07]KXA97622.1 hypothetical protein AKJ37_02605 [candidate division MSBL1 archaeon SCGC-AAA259I09]